MTEISLEKAIQDLRTQLQNAAVQGANADIRFVPKSIEVELAIKIDREAIGKAGVKLWSIFDLSASGKVGDENTHKVKLVLEPVDKEGKPTPISSDEVEDGDELER
jgi:hypothetical protein